MISFNKSIKSFLFLTLLFCAEVVNAQLAGVPEVSHPVENTELSGSVEQFEWQANDFNGEIEQWWLYVGSSPGGNDYHSAPHGLSTSAEVTDLPDDGSEMWVQLWWRVGGAWSRGDPVRYIATSIVTLGPQLVSPVDRVNSWQVSYWV